jgi:two-component system, NtrC family, sensor kinase
MRRQASVIAAEKKATMMEIAKIVGHEVANPLGLVINQSSFLQQSGIMSLKHFLERNGKRLLPEDFSDLTKIADKLETGLSRILHAGERINVVMKTLTHIVKPAKGDRRALNLLVLCCEAIEMTPFASYEDNQPHFDIKLSISSNHFIKGHFNDLLKVFVNLIQNADDAMMGQKNLKLEIKSDRDPEDPAMVKIEFQDSGTGIPLDLVPKIWLKGFSTKAKKPPSSDADEQGLFYCKQVIESVHNGTLAVESQPGKGTKFIVRLPLANESEG